MRVGSLLVWLLAVAAFVLLPVVGPAMPAVAAPAMSDCDHHSPPPRPCPEKDAAKHAAGLCCPSMSGALAVLPPAGPPDRRAASLFFLVPGTSSLIGLSPHQEPPPPRV